MGISESSCPSNTTWEKYAQAGATRIDSFLDAHIAQCDSCRQVYFSLIHKPYTPQVPHCHIVGEIGRGRFGVVYKAWWVANEPEIVALKLLHSFGDMERNRFEREIAVLSHLQSKGIVRCKDSGGAGDSRYFVMDFVAGTHFDQYVNQRGLDLNEKLQVLQMVCDAVADAHVSGVTHRDLKPRNILVDAQGQPHILDFGICSVHGVDWTSWADGTITLPGDIIGTLKYMSPEQAWGGVEQHIDRASDLWALGIMLYEIATDGDYPYALKSTRERPAPEALLERIRKELPKMPRLGHIPRGRDLETLIERCLTWEPQRRLSCASTLADDLGRFVAELPIRTRPHGRGYRARRVAVGAAARSRVPFHAVFVAVTLAALSLTALLGGVGWRVTGNNHSGSSSQGSMTSSVDSARADIRIIGIGDETAPHVMSFAAKSGRTGVTENVTTWRGVHGDLMEHLSRARPAAVIWDYYFRTAQPDDTALALGIRSMEAAGVPVVLAARTFGDRGLPHLSPTLLSALQGRARVGAILARDMVRRSGEFVAAIKRTDDTLIPSVTLVALAGMRRPEARLDAAWYGMQRSLDLLYAVGSGAYLRQRDRLDLTRVVPAGAPDPAVAAGDLLGCMDFSLAPSHHWRERTIPYESLLAMTDDEQRDKVGGKILIFGDVRTTTGIASGDRHPVLYPTGLEPDVPGCFLQADAMSGLLSHQLLRLAHPLTLPTNLALLVCAFVGCAIAKPVAAGPWFDSAARRGGAYGLAGGLIMFGLTIMCRSETSIVVHAGMGAVALAAPLAGSLWVEFTRNRHRMLDRQSRALRPFGTGSTALEPISAAA